jgi:hypothetical protein
MVEILDDNFQLDQNTNSTLVDSTIHNQHPNMDAQLNNKEIKKIINRRKPEQKSQNL